MKRCLFLFFIMVCQFLTAQEFSLITPLDDEVIESSGLILIDHKLITHNDSGNDPVLYEIDTLTGNVIREVTIGNAQNTDWEDIAFDENYIYIGDFGNNNGSRTDLKIYRVARTDFFSTQNNDTVSAQQLNFSFEDQINFNPSPFQTDFDCEALLTYQDSLYVFTKNWVNNKSDIYSLPKTPGTYSAKKVDSLNPEGLITGAAYNADSHTILLTGYSATSPFFVEISGFPSMHFSAGNIEKHSLQMPEGYSFQIEGITPYNLHQYYVSSEGGSFGRAGLYLLTPDSDFNTVEHSYPRFRLFPNPASTTVHIRGHHFVDVSVFSLDGKLKTKTNRRTLDVTDFQKGIYLLRIKNTSGATMTEKLVIE